MIEIGSHVKTKKEWREKFNMPMNGTVVRNSDGIYEIKAIGGHRFTAPESALTVVERESFRWRK